MNSNEWDNDYRQGKTIDTKTLAEMATWAKRMYETFDTKISHIKPEMPFTSEKDRERQFLQSMEHPKNYYNFQAFGVKICVHYIRGWSFQKLKIPKDDYYFIGIGGWYPTRKKWKCVSPHVRENKMNFFNPTTEMEEAVVNFYEITKDFLLSLGIGKYAQIELPNLKEKADFDECAKHRNCFTCNHFDTEWGKCNFQKKDTKGA